MDSYQAGFHNTLCRARLSLPAWCGGGNFVSSARTILLVFGRKGATAADMLIVAIYFEVIFFL